MFTTIQALRNSPALQERVSKVERYLNKRVTAFTPELIFPIAVIADSNDNADFEWVENHTSTHSKKGYVNGVHLDLSKFNIDGYEDLSKTKRIEAVEAAVNGLLGNPATAWKWTDGIFATAEGAVTPASQSGLTAALTTPEASGFVPTAVQGLTTPKKKEKKAAKPKAAKKVAAKKVPAKKAAKPAKVKPEAVVWLKSAVPANGTVSKGEKAKQRKNVQAALDTLVKSKHIDASALKTTKGTVYTIVL